MLNPKQKRASERIAEMIEESKVVASLERPAGYGGGAYIQDKVQLGAWLVKTKSIVELTFGQNSPHFREFLRLTTGHMEHSYEVNAVQGFLVGALDDLEKGFLVGQEFIVAGILFDSVLEEAKQLTAAGHKDASAVLARVVLEDSLKRIARRESVDDTPKAAKINDELKKKDVYSQPMWRQVQSWLDIGNSAAHGKFDEYSSENVRSMINGIEQFIAVHCS